MHWQAAGGDDHWKRCFEFVDRMVAAVPESDRKVRPQPSKQDAAAASESTEDGSREASKEMPAATADKADAKSDSKDIAKTEGTTEAKSTEESAEVRPPIVSGVWQDKSVPVDPCSGAHVRIELVLKVCLRVITITNPGPACIAGLVVIVYTALVVHE